MPKLHFTNTRYADLPLHYGKVPPWLAQRMTLLGGAIIESIVLEYGKSARPSLICPCDVHVDRIVLQLGLITRTQTDWKAAVELTNNLKKLGY